MPSSGTTLARRRSPPALRTPSRDDPSRRIVPVTSVLRRSKDFRAAGRRRTKRSGQGPGRGGRGEAMSGERGRARQAYRGRQQLRLRLVPQLSLVGMPSAQASGANSTQVPPTASQSVYDGGWCGMQHMTPT